MGLDLILETRDSMHPIKQVYMDNWSTVAKYDSPADAELAVPEFDIPTIEASADAYERGEYLESGGYIWEYVWEELAYGRKTWGIANFFRGRCDKYQDFDEVYTVTEDVWDEFIKYFKDYDLNKINRILDEIWDCGEDYDYNSKDYHYLQNFVDDLNYETPYLGYEWDARAMLRWYDANDAVKEAFANGQEVRLIASY